MKIFLKNNRGVTLVEVMVSIILVGIITTALCAIVAQSTVFSRRIDSVYTASLLAQRRLEFIGKLEFDDIASATETDIRIDDDGNMSISGDYSRTTEVTEDYNGNAILTKVKVTVKRADVSMSGGVSNPSSGRTVVMETLFADVE